MRLAEHSIIISKPYRLEYKQTQRQGAAATKDIQFSTRHTGAILHPACKIHVMNQIISRQGSERRLVGWKESGRDKQSGASGWEIKKAAYERARERFGGWQINEPLLLS